MRPLFSDAPVMPAAPALPQATDGTSQLARALMKQQPPLNLQPASFGNVPLASMMQAAQGTGDQVTSNTPDLAWNPNNPVGTDTLNPNTANRGDALSNAWATYGGGLSQMPGASQAPQNSPGSQGYQPTADDLNTMRIMQQSGALAPQYQQFLQQNMPGQPTPGSPGVPPNMAANGMMAGPV